MRKASRHRIARRIIIALLFLISVSILLYPTVSTQWNQRRNRALITEYAKSSVRLSAADYSAIRQAAEAYNAAHTQNVIGDVFSGPGEDGGQEYQSLLNPGGNGVMGYVSIPKIEQTLVIGHGTGTASLENGVGHIEGTSLPVGGAGTHAAIAGHRGLQHAKIFTDLDLLEIGDQFYLYVLDEVLAYEVDQISAVLPSDCEALEIVPGEDLVTLVTCTPYGVNSHRLLVRGHRVPYVEERQTEEAQKSDVIDTMDVSLKALMGAGLCLTLILLGMALAGLRRKRKGAARR